MIVSVNVLKEKRLSEFLENLYLKNRANLMLVQNEIRTYQIRPEVTDFEIEQIFILKRGVEK